MAASRGGGLNGLCAAWRPPSYRNMSTGGERDDLASSLLSVPISWLSRVPRQWADGKLSLVRVPLAGRKGWCLSVLARRGLPIPCYNRAGIPYAMAHGQSLTARPTGLTDRLDRQKGSLSVYERRLQTQAAAGGGDCDSDEAGSPQPGCRKPQQPVSHGYVANCVCPLLVASGQCDDENQPRMVDVDVCG
jgi:hypothetical protein